MNQQACSTPDEQLFGKAIWRLDPRDRQELCRRALRALREDVAQLVCIKPSTLVRMFNTVVEKPDNFLEWYLVIVALVHSPTFYEHVARVCIPESAKQTGWLENCRRTATTSLTQFTCFQRADGKAAAKMSELLMFNLHHFVLVVLFEWRAL